MNSDRKINLLDYLPKKADEEAELHGTAILRPPIAIDAQASLKSLENEDTESKERIVHIDISKLTPFPSHPFLLYTGDKLTSLAESIEQVGIVSPILVRTQGEDSFQIIAGHNRVNAAKLIGLESAPAIILDVDDDEATAIMLITNLEQREELTIREKAFAYKMKYEQIKKARLLGRKFGLKYEFLRRYNVPVQKNSEILGISNGYSENMDGIFDEINGGPVDPAQKSSEILGWHNVPPQKSTEYSDEINGVSNGYPKKSSEILGWHNVPPQKSREILSEKSGDSERLIAYYIALTDLIPSILDLVDSEEMAIRAGVALSYLSKEEQGLVWDTLKLEENPELIGIDLAEKIKRLSESKALTAETLLELIKPKEKETAAYKNVSLPMRAIENILPAELKGKNQRELTKILIEALKQYYNKGDKEFSQQS